MAKAKVVSDTENRELVNAAIRRRFGEESVLTARQMPVVRFIPFGVLGLDYISGGGVPLARMTRMFGAYSSGKSLASWRAIYSAQNIHTVVAQRQQHLARIAKLQGEHGQAKAHVAAAEEMLMRWPKGMQCAYINAENQVDPLYLDRLGIRIDDLDIFNLTRIEDIGTAMDVMVTKRSHNLIVIDSTSAAISVDTLGQKEGLYHNDMGVEAKKWKRVLNWINDRLASEKPDIAVIFISQVSGGTMGTNTQAKHATEEPPGGRGMEHASSLTLHFVKGKWLFRHPGGFLKPEDEKAENVENAFGKKQPAGREVSVLARKSRVSRQDRSCLLHLDKDKSNFDELHDLEKYAKYFGIAVPTTSGSTWYRLPDGSKTQTLRKKIAAEPTLQEAIRDVTLRCSADPWYERDLLRSMSHAS